LKTPAITPEAVEKLRTRSEEEISDSGVPYHEFPELLETLKKMIPGRDDYPDEVDEIEYWLWEEYLLKPYELSKYPGQQEYSDDLDMNKENRRLNEIMAKLLSTVEKVRMQFWIAAVNAVRNFDATIYVQYEYLDDIEDIPAEEFLLMKREVDAASKD